MKPIELVIKGLFSYRDEITLDFRPFYETRLFGVFGKTGDGKSSLLDAMTFALYGRLDRLGRNLKEAVNPRTGQIKVSFSFELDQRRYQVRRTYLPGSGTQVILYEERQGKWFPLAEKAREVEQKLSSILGLSFEEFTKVVILPQGKFAEFLKLRPSERAEMLENLFGLEKYGEVLYQRLARHLEGLRARLEEKEARLQALEGVSPEKIKELEEELVRLTKRIQKLEREKIVLLGRLEGLRESLRLISEKKKIEEKLASLLSSVEEIENKRRRLAQGERLQPVQEIFEEFKALEEELPHKEARLGLSKKLLTQKEEKLAGLRQMISSFREEVARRRMEISVAEARVQEAKRLCAALEAKRMALQEREKALKELDVHRQTQLKEKQRLESRLQEFSLHEKKLQDGLQELEFSPDEKALFEDLRRLQPLLGRLKERKTQEDTILAILSRQKEELALVNEEIAQKWQELVAFPFPGVTKARNLLLEELLQCDQALEEIETQLEGLSKRHQAALLAEGLLPGQPCPVCGSLEHPQKARLKEVEERFRELKSRRKILHQKKTFLRKAERILRDLLEKGVRLDREVRQRTEELRKYQEETRQLEDLLKKELAGRIDLEEVSLCYENFEYRKKRVLEIRTKIDSLRTEREKVFERLGLIKEELSKIEIESSGLRAEKEALASETRDLMTQIQERVGQKDPEALLRDLEREKRELDSQEKELLEKEKSLEGEVKRLSEEVAALKGRIEEKKKRREQLQGILEEVAQREGLPLSELETLFLSETERNRLEEAIRDWEKAFQETKVLLERVERELKEAAFSQIPPGEPAATEEKLKQTEEILKRFQQRKGQLEGEILRLQRELTEKESLSKEVQRLKRELVLTDQLRNLLRGRALVKFAARYLFVEILAKANRLLRDLLGERFVIQMARDDFSFTVYDLRLGHERPIETLSGGEIFLVSFSLALALSAYIQEVRARPIHFFFIDEGFGSLDEDLLEAVSEVLQGLRSQDRLIGVITHLERFKQLLPAYILVRKDETGASRLESRVFKRIFS